MSTVVKTSTILDKKQTTPIKWEDGNFLGITLCVTEDCNLRCSYCYMVGKNHFRRMSWETGKRIVDFILNDPYCTGLTDNLMLDFIGGEPLLEMDLIDKICDYTILSLYTMKHKWLDNFHINFSTNGTLYNTTAVRSFVEKHYGHCSFGFSMDGSKEKHDLSRKTIDGNGSYDMVLEGFKAYKEDFKGDVHQKSTFSSEDLIYLKESIIHLWDLGFQEVQSNLVYEDVWQQGDPELFEEQLVELADYMFDSGRYEDHKVAYFDKRKGLPITNGVRNMNRCGAGYKSLAFDCEGNIYPCIRFLDFCLENKMNKTVGNIDSGIDYNALRALCGTTWKSVSPDQCINCTCGDDCGWCVAHNFDQTGSLYNRTTDLCEMHKANARANKYFWNKWERTTGRTSERTLEKVLHMDHNELKYVYFITSSDAPAFCSYEKMTDVNSSMSKRIYEDGLNFCIDNEALPIFLGNYPIDLDPSKKVYFEIDLPRDFRVPSCSIAVVDKETKHLPISAAAINYRITREDISNLSQDINQLSSHVKRINLFIIDINSWSDEDLINYENSLNLLSNIIVSQYKEGDYSLQINILTDRLLLNNEPRDCRAGINSVALAPNGLFYICPAFYFTNQDWSIGSLTTGIDQASRSHYFRDKSAMCSSCTALACQRCLYNNKLTTDEYCVPSANQCRINYIQANAQSDLSIKLQEVMGESYPYNHDIPKLEYIDYVANQIYNDERARARKWIY